MKVENITAQQTREFSQFVIGRTKSELTALQAEMVKLKKRWDVRNELSQSLYGKGLSIYEMPEEKEELSAKEFKWAADIRRTFWGRHKEDVKIGKVLKPKFQNVVTFLQEFYNALPYHSRKYFKEVDDDDIKEQLALFLMAHSHNRHMFHKTQDWDQMKWLGFVWKKGWHYNDINYGM